MTGLSALRRFTRERPRAERCELCGNGLEAAHPHLVDPSAHELRCACGACAILFGAGARWKRVQHRAEWLPDFRLSDAQWEALRIPIGLAWFFQSSSAGRVVAFYPGPAGATQSLITLDAWESLAAQNPLLRELAPDTEALLANRVGEWRDHFRVSIDECYRLVGLLRLHWRGFSGGSEAWEKIESFFAGLKGAPNA